MHTLEELAYAAGLFDGEGSVSFCRHGTENRHPEVTVTNTDRELAEVMRRSFGGRIIHRPARHQNHRDAWVWKLSHAAAVEFLKLVLPYLRQATKIKRARMLVEEYPHVVVRNGKYTAEQLSARREFEERFFAEPCRGLS